MGKADDARRQREEAFERGQRKVASSVAKPAAPKQSRPKKAKPVSATPGEAKSASGSIDSAAWVRAVRESTGLSQAAFAARYGFSVRTVEGWERKTRPAKPGFRATVALVAIHASFSRR